MIADKVLVMHQLTQGKQVKIRRRYPVLRFFVRTFLWAIPILALLVGMVALSFLINPPFGYESTARVLIIGLDDTRDGTGPRRSDTIILLGARLDGSGSTLLSVPRDAWVNIPGYHGVRKINAAYALGGDELLRTVLGREEILEADLPYHLIIDSNTVRAVVDALGGIEVDVPHAMDYDDDWGNLHIHLKAGRQVLNGEQAVGFLRWRKNNHGGGASDFARGERQRQVVIAIGAKMRTWQGILRAPDVYAAFRRTSESNLTFRQLIQLGWAARHSRSEAVPAVTFTSGGVSYVDCNWSAGREIWQAAIGERFSSQHQKAGTEQK